MKAIKRTIALIIALVLVRHSLDCTAATPDSLFMQYSKLLSPEKVYLHTDREVYNLGDTIWFRGYLQNASAIQEYPESNYIYVDIISPKWETDYDNKIKEFNRIRERVIIKKDSTGRFSGYIPLSSDFNTGLATIRAYTHWMLNCEPDYMFAKNIEIINPMKDGFVKNLTKIQMKDDFNYTELGVKNPFRKSKPKQKSETGIDLQLLPESGRYIADTPSVVGIKALNQDGLGVKVLGRILADSVVVGTFETNRLGMGKAIISVPQNTKKITVEAKSFVEEFLFNTTGPLPEKSAVVINALPDSNGVNIALTDCGINMPDSSFLVVYDKTEFIFKSPYTEAKKGKRVLYNDLSPGINTIAVIDNSGNVYAQRPFFVFQKNKPVAEAIFDKQNYKRRERACISLSLRDNCGKPLSGNFSLAITDEEYAPDSAEGHSIESYMMLGAEIKGYIEKPQLYFADSLSLETRINNMDLLMITQGWCYYDLPKILKGKTVIPKYGKEYTQSISGYVQGLFRKAKKSTLCFLAPSINYSQIVDIDSTSYFELHGLDFPDSTQFFVGAQARRKYFKKLHTPILNPQNYAAVHPYPQYLKSRGYSDEYADLVTKSYYSTDGTITYTLAPVRVTAQRELSLYPNDSFKRHQYRDKKQFANYGSYTLFDYISMTCRGVYIIEGALCYRSLMVASKMKMGGSPYRPINIFCNGFLINHEEARTIVMEDVLAFAFVDGSDAAKYAISNDIRDILRPKPVVFVKTQWPVHSAPNVTAEKYFGWQRPAKFYEPKYTTKEEKERFEPIRPTLHWQPQVTFVNGKAEVAFYTSDHKAPLTLILEGITDNGDFVHFKTTKE